MGSARTSRTEANACHECHTPKTVFGRLAGCASIPRVWVCCEVRVGRPGPNMRPGLNMRPGHNMANTNLMQHRHLARRSALGQAMGMNGTVGPKTSSRSQTVEMIRPKASYEYSCVSDGTPIPVLSSFASSKNSFSINQPLPCSLSSSCSRVTTPSNEI